MLSVRSEPLINAAIAFFLGFAIAVPILAVPVFLGISGYFAFDWLAKKISPSRISRVTIAVALIFAVFLASRKALKVWISSTLLNTLHGADKVSINFLSWVEYFFEEWLIAPNAISLVLFTLTLGYLILYGAQILRSNFSSIDESVSAFTIAMAGFALNIAIIMNVKRLWGFYLYPGTVLMIVGIIILADLSIANDLKRNKGTFIGIARYMAYSISTLLLIISLLYWFPRAFDGLKHASLRTQTPEYAMQYSSFTVLKDFLDNNKFDEGKQLRVMITPSLFLPESNKKYEIIEFWGPFNSWELEPDVIIFGLVNTPRGTPTPADSSEYSRYLMEQKGYLMHVLDHWGFCKASPCYEKVLSLPNGGEILVLRKS